MSSDSEDRPRTAPEPARRRGVSLAGVLLWVLKRHAALASWVRAARAADRPRWQRWVCGGATMAVGALVGVALVAWVATKDIGNPPAWLVWGVGAVIGAGSTASALAVRRLRHRLGLLTSAAFVSLVWGLSMGGLAWAQPQCALDNDGIAGRCTLSETATYVAIGMLFVVALVAVFYPPYLFVRCARWAARARGRAIAWAEAKRAGKAQPVHAGRITHSPTRSAGSETADGGSQGDVSRGPGNPRRSGNPKVRGSNRNGGAKPGGRSKRR